MKSTRSSYDDTSAILAPVSKTVPIEQVGELPADHYVGLIDDQAIAHLAVRLAAEGLHNAIWVRQNGNAAKARFSVIAGRHRLRAARALGWTEIEVEVRAGQASTTAELKRLQLIENLDRRTPRPIERACLIMERWQSEACKQGWDIVSHARDLDDLTGRQCGNVDGRTIRRYRRIFENIVVAFPDQFALINAHPLGESQSAMQTLASQKLIEPTSVRPVGVNNRRMAVDKLLERTDWKNIDEVLLAAGIHDSNGRRGEGAVDSGLKLRNVWRALPIDAKRTHFVEMASDIPPFLVRETIELLKKRLP
ncbi:MAG: ParB N-terminal domain-containing protein [Novosphingobium sp.]|nr:ParB N-terminal domain-containing protein [Novosphingobium sp.]